MSAVRELVARLGFQVDKSGFQQAEQAIGKVREGLRRAGGEARRAGAKVGLAGGETGRHYRDAAGRMRDAQTGRYVGKGGKKGEGGSEAGSVLKTLGKLAATAGIEHVLEGIVELGSRAEETANVLGAVFGKDRQAEITQWAETTAAEVGRSKYALAEMAGQLGAVATPMLGNQQRAMEMSEAFAKLAVDMGSFYNSTDEDALAALRSAMTGEVESIKRFGVVMNDATMQEYARTQGIKKKINQMTIAEKTELRYGYIMKATAAAQGDAARTSNGYANSIKAVKAMMMDFGTDMGRAVLPMIERLLVNVREGIAWFKQMTDGTVALQAAMGVLAGIAAALAVEMLLPWIPAAMGVAALVLLIDELYQLFTGGESVIGDFIDSMFGIGTTEDVVNSLRGAWQWLSDTFTELKQTLPDLTGMFELLMGVGEDFGVRLQMWHERLLRFVKTVMNLPNILGKKVASALGFKVDQDDAEGRAAGRGVDAGVLDEGSALSMGWSGNEALEAHRRDRDTQVRAGVDKRAEERRKRNEIRERRQQAANLDKTIEDTQDKLAKDPNLSAADRAQVNEQLAAAIKKRDELRAGDAVADPTARRYGVARTREQQALAAAAPNASYSPDSLSSVDPTLFPPATVSVPPSAAMSSMPSIQQTVTNQTTIQINGGDTEKVRKVVRAELDANNRRAAAALPRPAGA